jgi:hypothetical protein
MCCRPTCVQRPSYPGCYDTSRGELKIPIKIKNVKPFISKQKEKILDYISKGKFKTFKQEGDQFVAKLSYSDNISKIFTLTSLTYLGPFNYMVRLETSRRYKGDKFSNRLVIKEYFVGEDTTELIEDYGTNNIRTIFNVTLSRKVKDKLNNGFQVLDYNLDDVVNIDENYLLTVLEENILKMINKTFYVTENDISIEYGITHPNLNNINIYDLIIHDIEN